MLVRNWNQEPLAISAVESLNPSTGQDTHARVG
jgi:hypothetical protein